MQPVWMAGLTWGSPHPHARRPGSQASDRAGWIVQAVLLPLADQVDIHDRRAAVAFFVVSVRETDMFQIQPGDDADAGAVEVLGQLGLQVDRVAVLDDADGHRASDDELSLIHISEPTRLGM